MQAVQRATGPVLGGSSTGSHPLKLPGWLMTALAVSFGAPFWFEALPKLGSLRDTSATQQPSQAGADAVDGGKQPHGRRTEGLVGGSFRRGPPRSDALEGHDE